MELRRLGCALAERMLSMTPGGVVSCDWGTLGEG